MALSLSPVVPRRASAQDTTARRDSSTAGLRQLDDWLTFLRKRNAQTYAITSPNGIDESKYVRVGGIEQWITIRGDDRRNPVILLLHGGPGDVTSPYGYAVFRSWTKRFTLVQWDQRGAGRTLGKNGKAIGPTITLDRMVQDGIELLELIRKELDRDKVIVVGHSLGSIIGVKMAKARPDLFYAFVGTGQVVDPARNQSIVYDGLLKHEERQGDEQAVRELKQAGPPPWKDGKTYQVYHKWANWSEHADVVLAANLGFALQAPGYSARDINDWFDGQGLSAQYLIPETSGPALPASALAGDFAIPVFVIQGAEDFTTSTSLARDYVKRIQAPQKAFVSIEGAGHFAAFMKPDVFLREMERLVLPLTRHR